MLSLLQLYWVPGHAAMGAYTAGVHGCYSLGRAVGLATHTTSLPVSGPITCVEAPSPAACAPWASRSVYQYSHVHNKFTMVCSCVVHCSVLLAVQHFSGPWLCNVGGKTWHVCIQKDWWQTKEKNQQGLRISTRELEIFRLPGVLHPIWGSPLLVVGYPAFR